MENTVVVYKSGYYIEPKQRFSYVNFLQLFIIEISGIHFQVPDVPVYYRNRLYNRVCVLRRLIVIIIISKTVLHGTFYCVHVCGYYLSLGFDFFVGIFAVSMVFRDEFATNVPN